ncbi:type I restriction endonuclease subunit R [Thioalkalivibrio sp. HK1]|uniref:type I restriction endonuclease subunit R n=1 Tax=Thioalkalivibrio sp. HK1 TaxID=1469245 RepID=UPI0004722F1F|nr:type I restriction endonuclease subunit R [Thioalkalivibrio sp. HK1]
MSTSESQLEQSLIDRLVGLKYEHRSDIRDRASLEANFRKKFEDLNRVRLSDSEFRRLLDQVVKQDVYEAARSLRERETFIREDGTPLNYTLINIKDWCKNTFEVVNQLRINTDNSHHRYDVILLINGIPAVQIELKTLGIEPRRAMEQIVKYKNDPGNGYTKTLLCFVQLFIVSNRTDTRYFANNNVSHFAFDADERFLPVYRFAAPDNSKIIHLDDFADHFLAKCTLGNMISKYMVLIAGDKKLMMMRPYQIYAVKAIVDCIDQNCGNGYIWHTTGSGKTLTSFKAATLLKSNENIHKCLFVVDRKDLDRQTRDEFNRFQKNCVEENTNTAALVRRLLSEDYADKVIVTTIQKLGLALDENSKRNRQNLDQGRSTFKQRLEHLREKRMVFIFDECHRSQFGENHRAIKEFFPNSQLFGFTGTPIFEQNATIPQIEGNVASLRTTEEIFQQQLHAYTITDAIEDENVLRFHVDYYKPKDAETLKPGQALKKRAVVESIIDKHNISTGDRRFNALLATASINDAIEYHQVFKEIQAERQAADPEFDPLKIAAIFSPPAQGDQDVQQIQEDLPQEKEDNKNDPEGKKAALKAIIEDYNKQYRTNHDINNFDLYYQDIQKRIKNQKFSDRNLRRKESIDITIVVDMLLTGFDARYLNTLYVDKNLKHHGLIQAFSRTNRVLNGTKPHGQILDFRGQRENVDAAIALFSGVQTDQAKEIWLVEPARTVIDEYAKAVADIEKFITRGNEVAEPRSLYNLKGDMSRIEFVNRFKKVQRLRIKLDRYTDLDQGEKKRIKDILPEDDLRELRGQYIETARRLREQRGDTGAGGEPVNPDVDQLEFEFVLFASALIDYDYIMKLLAEYSGQDPEKLKISREELISMIESDAKFMDEREEITEYVRSLRQGEGLDEAAIREGYEQFKAERLAKEIAEIAGAHGLTTEALSDFVDTILQRMIFDGEQLTDLMEPLELGWRERRDRELALMADLVPLLNKRAHGREISGLSAYEQGGVR